MRAVGVGHAQAEHDKGCLPFVSGGSRRQLCLLVSTDASRRLARLIDASQLVRIGCHWARQYCEAPVRRAAMLDLRRHPDASAVLPLFCAARSEGTLFRRPAASALLSPSAQLCARHGGGGASRSRAHEGRRPRRPDFEGASSRACATCRTHQASQARPGTQSERKVLHASLLSVMPALRPLLERRSAGCRVVRREGRIARAFGGGACGGTPLRLPAACERQEPCGDVSGGSPAFALRPRWRTPHARV